MKKNIHFVINEDKNFIEFHVNGECITDCFSLDNTELIDLVEQLSEFADVPIYKKFNFKKEGY